MFTGRLEWVENHLTQWVEGKPYPVIRVESLKAAEQPQRGEEAPQPDKEAGRERTFFNVDVRGVLRVSGKLRKINELESPPNINSPAHAIDNRSVATGATLDTRQMGEMEIYFGGDEQLQEKARSLSGKTCALSGRLERVTFYSKQDKERFGLLYGGGGGTTQEFWREVPALITKTYIRVLRLEAAEQPRPEGKPQPEPAKGEPSGKANEDVFDHQRFCVTIWPTQPRVTPGVWFEVKLRVVNSSAQVQSFKVWSCSWNRHWKWNNRRIDYLHWPCWDNAIIDVRLQPGEVYENVLLMMLTEKSTSKTESLHMGFTPSGERKTYGSNEVVLGVNPAPDKGQEKDSKAAPNPDDKQQSPQTAAAKDVELILNWLCGGKAGGAFERDFGDSHWLSGAKNALFYTDVDGVSAPTGLKQVPYDFIRARMERIRRGDKASPAVLVTRTVRGDPEEDKLHRGETRTAMKNERFYYVEVAIGNRAWHGLKIVVGEVDGKRRTSVLQWAVS